MRRAYVLDGASCGHALLAAGIYDAMCILCAWEETVWPMVHAPDFVGPVCPRCTSNGVLLEGVEPGNQWRCEDCGHSWKDAVSDQIR